MAEDELKLRVVLDPNGLQSQLAQLKQEVGLTVQGALSNAAGTVNVASHAAGMLAGDVSGALGSVLTAPRAPDDVTLAQSAMYATFPGVTAPRSYDVQRWGQMHADRVSTLSGNYAMNLTHGIGKTMADWGAFEVGMATVGLVGAAVGAPAAGLGSAGAVAMGVLGMAGGMAAGYGAGEMYENIFQRSIVGAASRGIVQNLGGRFGVRPSDDIIRGIQDIQAGGGYGIGETTGALSTGLQFGVFGQVRGAEDFKEKFKSLMKGAKEIANTMNVGMEDAVQTIAQMQGAGFGSIENAVHSLRAARVTARATGIPGAEANELMLAGASMSMGTGYSAAFGASNTLSNYEAVTMGLRAKQGQMGALDMETVMQLGGRARAAQAMTQSNMAYMEGPLGRATLLASYNPATGLLDPGRSFGYAPGMAFKQAVDTMRGAENPMTALLEFSGKRSRLASELAPEEIALSQVQTWASLARMVDPKGPITNDMLVGAAAKFGVNPEVARAQISMVTNSKALLQKQQNQRAAIAEAAEAQEREDITLTGAAVNIGEAALETAPARVVGRGLSVLGRGAAELGDVVTGGVVSRGVEAARSLAEAGAEAYGGGSAEAGVLRIKHSFRTSVGNVTGAVSTGAEAVTGTAGRAWEGLKDIARGGARSFRPSSVSRTKLGEIIRGKERLGRTIVGLLHRPESELKEVTENVNRAVTVVLDNAAGESWRGASQEDREFFMDKLEEFTKFATLGPDSDEALKLRAKLIKESKSYGGGDPDLREQILKNLHSKNTPRDLRKVAMWERAYFEQVTSDTIIDDAFDALGGSSGDTAFSREFLRYERGVERAAQEAGVEGIKIDKRAGLLKGILAAARESDVAKKPFGGVLGDLQTILRRTGAGLGGEASLEDLKKLKLNFLSDQELKEAAGKDSRLSAEEAAALVATEISVSRRRKLGAASVSGAESPKTYEDMREMLGKTSRALEEVTGLLKALKGSPVLQGQ